jgi:hypothetical protein
MKVPMKSKANYSRGVKNLPKDANLKVTGGSCKVCDQMKPKILKMSKSDKGNKKSMGY